MLIVDITLMMNDDTLLASVSTSLEVWYSSPLRLVAPDHNYRVVVGDVDVEDDEYNDEGDDQYQYCVFVIDCDENEDGCDHFDYDGCLCLCLFSSYFWKMRKNGPLAQLPLTSPSPQATSDFQEPTRSESSFFLRRKIFFEWSRRAYFDYYQK